MTTAYRKLWEDTYGPIPVDEDGDTYHIHHINGDHEDNRIENLACVTKYQHFEEHKLRGDFGGCILLVMHHFRCSPEEKSTLISELHSLWKDSGEHHLYANNPNIERVINGTHNFIGDSCPNKDGRNARAAMNSGRHVCLTSKHLYRKFIDKNTGHVSSLSGHTKIANRTGISPNLEEVIL